MSASTAATSAAGLETRRVAAVAELAAGAGVEALLVSDPPTMRWLGLAEPGDSRLMIEAGTARVVPASDGDVDGEAPQPSAGWPRISIPVRAAGADRRLRELAAAIATARAVKDAEELARITAAAALVEAGHRGLRETLEPGLSELELWDGAARAIVAAGGDPDRAGVDLMVGARTSLVGELPGEALLADGDPVLFDLAPQLDGYWADSCATFACGAPSPALRRRHAAVAAALERGRARARPGTSAGAVDAAIRERLAADGLECPHHTGHGVGVAAQEPPWFVPGNEFVLERGMVVALEPGAYADGFGVRLEHLAVIEAGGARPLTQHPLTIDPR